MLKITEIALNRQEWRETLHEGRFYLKLTSFYKQIFSHSIEVIDESTAIFSIEK